MNAFASLIFIWINTGHHAANSVQCAGTYVIEATLAGVSKLVVSEKCI